MIIKIEHPGDIINQMVTAEDDLDRFNDLVINTKNIFSVETYEKDRGRNTCGDNSEVVSWTELGLIINGVPLIVDIIPNTENIEGIDLYEQASDNIQQIYKQIVDAMEKDI